MSTNIYILKLENGNYYVGKSTDPESRIQQHFNGVGSSWTQIHKPVRVEAVLRNMSDFDEDRFVKEYMAKYGIDKVRGGAYANIHLDEIQKESVEREIRGATDVCTRCGRSGHFAAYCYARTAVAKSSHFNGGKTKAATSSQSNGACYRCGRKGHYVADCYASTNSKGYEISDDDDDEYYYDDSD